MKRISIILVAGMAVSAHAAFKCTDEKGEKHYEDIPPAACANVPIYEVGKSGNVVRTIDGAKPPAPPADPAKKTEMDRVTLDRERRDRTLLDTYSNEREIDQARDRSLELMKARKQSAQSQLELVKKRRVQLEANKGSQKSDIDFAAREQASLEHAIAGYDAEAQRVTDQYETDKSRWRELSAGRKR